MQLNNPFLILSLGLLIVQSAESQTQVSSFEQCVSNGGTVVKTLPAKCIWKDGTEFKQPALNPQKIDGFCKNLCGDGECQEIVCMAMGCPCAETPQSCPKDCGVK